MNDRVVATEIMTTGWCPHDCSYCYLPKTDAMRDMHEDIQDNLGDLLHKTDEVFDEVRYLGFWGTEPLLTLDEFSLGEINNRFPELKEVSFSTSLLSHVDVLIGFLNKTVDYDFDVDVQVSIDGPYTNENRMEGAVDIIKDNLNQLLNQTNAEFNLHWKSTITPENIRDMIQQGVGKYYEFFEELNDFVDGKIGEGVKFQKSYSPTLMVPGRYSQKDGEDFAKFLKLAHDKDYDSAYTGRLKRLSREEYMDQISERPHTGTCSGGDTQFGFDGDDVHICHRTFYLNQEEYVQSVKDQNQDSNWDVSHFKSGTVDHLQDKFMADAESEEEMTKLKYVMRNYHDYWSLKLSMTKGLILEMAASGQVDERYRYGGDDEARDLFALFLNTGLSCPVESIMNTGTMFLKTVSEIRMFGNGAMKELEQRVGDTL